MLCIVMLGGRHPRALIGVHDVVFAQADTLEQLLFANSATTSCSEGQEPRQEPSRGW